jgi:dinuclear metal center YbgI/SA1388 family protein
LDIFVVMKIRDITNAIAAFAPLQYQESYDNAGLLFGNADWEVTGVLLTLDATEAVIDEAIERGCNLVIAHHPIVFAGLKKINGSNYVERVAIKAIKHDIAIYASHTNLDNVRNGVSEMMARQLQLRDCRVLSPKRELLAKLHTFVPREHADKVLSALFAAGAGHIGNYSECSFNVDGIGGYKAGAGTQPFAGQVGQRHLEPETKLEVIFPLYLEPHVMQALTDSHPYEEVAYDVIKLGNAYSEAGSGLIGT